MSRSVVSASAVFGKYYSQTLEKLLPLMIISGMVRQRSGVQQIRRTVKRGYVRSGAGKASGSGAARRTFPAAISRRATTIARLSDAKRGFAPLRSCFALFAASITSSKRLGISDKQSSTVILAMRSCYLAASRLTRECRKRSVNTRESESFPLLQGSHAPV